MQSMWSLTGIIAPGLAAFLISLPALSARGAWGGTAGRLLTALSDGTPLAIGVDSVSFVLAAVVLLFVFIPSPKRADLAVQGKPRKSVWQDISVGIRYIWLRKPMLWLLGTFTVVNLVGQLGVVFPLVVKFNLASDWTARGFTFETALAMLNTANSIGALAAGFLLSLWGGLKRRRVYGVVVPMVIGGVFLAAMGFSQSLYLSSALIFLLGFSFPAANVHSQAIWQAQVPRELQGRVFAVRRVIAQCSGPLGAAIAGWAAGMFDPGITLSVMGAILALFCLVQTFNPYLLRVEDREYLEALAAKSEVVAG
jgi:MFS transporter, DHA3 family, macrolide efflux protein